MKTRHIIATVGAVVVTAALIAAMPSHIGPSQLYPNPTLSPGLIATDNLNDLTSHSACGTYSECHRNTTDAQKRTVRAEYPTCPPEQEIDHILPLSIGGADDVKNLWCQPLNNMWNGQNWGYKTKDAIESYLASQVKNGKIAPKIAQECILNDWIACYQQYLGKQPTFGGVNNQVDPDGL